MDRVRLKAGTQITLEDDMNIPDVKPDVNTLIYEKGTVKIDEVKPLSEHVNVKGRLIFCVLYQAGEGEMGLASVNGEIPFEEQVFMEGVTAMDQVEVTSEVEDLKVNMINSRKLNIQAILSMQLKTEEMYDEEAAVEIYQDFPMEYRKKNMEVAQLAIRKNDIFRMKEEIKLPQNYPNIFQIIWDSTTLNDVEFRTMEEKISVQGELRVFLLYEAEGEEQQIRSFETTLPFNGIMECHGCQDNMIPDIRYEIGHLELEAKPDYDGEERIIGIEMVLDICMRLYMEEKVEILSDVYGVTKEVTAQMRGGEFKQLLTKTTGKCKISDHMKLNPSDARILQLMHSDGMVQIDNISVAEDGVLIEGTVLVKVLYITGDDNNPYGCVRGMIPFSYHLEVADISIDDYISLEPQLEQLAVTMLDSEELDVKAVIALRAVVFRKIKQDVIADLQVQDIDSQKINSLPGISIYMVKSGDNLWNIGKKYYVSVECIKEMNGLSSDEVKPGDKLLIVKAVNEG